MMDKDSFQKFLLSDLQIRGEWVRLNASLDEACSKKNYHPTVRSLLAETAAASVLLTGTLKFEGLLSIHARGSGPLTLLTAECSDQRQFRCLANGAEDVDVTSSSLQDLLGQAQLAITIDPANGQRYQGIVPLERASMGACLAHYFELSEQLDTYFAFFETDAGIAALMLQKLPDYKDIEDQDAWERICQFAETLTREEVQENDNRTLITRLFHEESVNLYPSEPVHFQCSCSKERSLASLKALGEVEALSILEERPLISIDCHFCGAHYEIDRPEVNALFGLGATH